eukprot:1143766-Pleurochrysis_carterae.AAC.1
MMMMTASPRRASPFRWTGFGGFEYVVHKGRGAGLESKHPSGYSLHPNPRKSVQIFLDSASGQRTPFSTRF